MKIYPALDILDGKCVRLEEGNFEKGTLYSENPQTIVELIEESGGDFLHLVDLSGARNPLARQVELIQKLILKSRLKIQVGGGIRSLHNVADLLQLGVDRVVLGSIALLNPDLTRQILKEFGPDRITLAMDVKVQKDRSIQIASEGWMKSSSRNTLEWLQEYLSAGVQRVLCTDIQRDGMMTGPSFDLYEELIGRFPSAEFQASGGVAQLSDLLRLKKVGLHSAIVGKAFYEKRISLPEAIRESAE